MNLVLKAGRRMVMLDCQTPTGKKFITHEANVKNILCDKLNIRIDQPDLLTSHDDGFIYKGQQLIGVCEIKTRPYWSRDKKTPFTLKRFLNDGDGYLITAWKLTWLRDQSKKNNIYSYIFLNIPHDESIVKFRVTRQSGDFFIKYNTKNSTTYYSANDYKGKTQRLNAYIPYKENEKHIEIIKYGLPST